jgi:tRNA nucleotidyltransferase/poly(A) polymerase
MSSLPDKVPSLAEAVRAEGGRALLVGGCVRDELMGREAKDWTWKSMELSRGDCENCSNSSAK